MIVPYFLLHHNGIDIVLLKIDHENDRNCIKYHFIQLEDLNM